MRVECLISLGFHRRPDCAIITASETPLHTATLSANTTPASAADTSASDNYTLELLDSALKVDAAEWDGLLAQQSHATPFMRHAYLAAMETSESANADTGWTPVFCLLKKNGVLEAKSHSYGEYVFDWAWADAYQRHGLQYYPKGVLAVPFTPVPGIRLLAKSEQARTLLLKGVIDWAQEAELSSMHMLFAADEDLQAAQNLGQGLQQPGIIDAHHLASRRRGVRKWSQ